MFLTLASNQFSRIFILSRVDKKYVSHIFINMGPCWTLTVTFHLGMPWIFWKVCCFCSIRTSQMTWPSKWWASFDAVVVQFFCKKNFFWRRTHDSPLPIFQCIVHNMPVHDAMAYTNASGTWQAMHQRVVWWKKTCCLQIIDNAGGTWNSTVGSCTGVEAMEQPTAPQHRWMMNWYYN